MNDIFAFKWRAFLRAAVAAVLVFVIFVKLCEFFVIGSDPYAAASVILGPDDFASVMRICLVALLASAVGTLVCTDSSSRPVVAALALGMIFLKLGTPAIWEQAGAVAEPARRLYSVYYLVYALWTVAILYSGYVGQYVAGRLILRRKDARTESAMYVAENAGVGLAASALSGGIAMLVMVGFAALLVPGGTPGRPVVVRHSDLQILWDSRVYGLFVVLAFFIPAYVTALVVRPRTSTWVACGAIMGVMLLPGSVASVLHLVTLQEAEEFPRLAGVLVPFSRLMDSLSPFAFAGLAIGAALAGDWTGKQLVAYARRRQSIQVYKPL